MGARPDTGRNFSWGAFSFYLVGRFKNGPRIVRKKKGRQRPHLHTPVSAPKWEGGERECKVEEERVG